MAKLTKAIVFIFFVFSTFFALAREVRVSYYDYGILHRIDKDGKYSGFGYDIAELMAKTIGTTNIYVGHDKTWGENEKMVENGEIDIIDCVRMLPGREKRYEFSAQPMGFSFASLLVRTNETRFAEGGYRDWGKVKVSIMHSDAVGREFDEFADIHGIDYEKYEYFSAEAALDALAAGEVDMSVMENTFDTSNFTTIEQFNPKPYYFCTKKGNTELMDLINRAMKIAYEENPSWYIEICRKYYPRKDVIVYIPRTAHLDDTHLRYIKAMADLLAAIGGWNPVYKDCAADCADVDFSVPCIVADLRRTPENRQRFDFPMLPAYRRPVVLACGKNGGEAEAALDFKEDRIYTVGYDRRERIWLECFEKYAQEYNLAYRLREFDSTAELTEAAQAQKVDLAIIGANADSRLCKVKNCGYVNFDFATPKGQSALYNTLDMAIRFIRYHEARFSRRIENYAYGNDNKRTVRAGVYVEFGGTEICENGDIKGFIVEYLREVARLNNWDLVFVPMKYSDIFECLASGEIDIASMTSPFRETSEFFDLTRRDVSFVRYSLKVKTDSELRSNRPDLWRNNRIGYLAGSYPIIELRNYLDSIGAQYRLLPYESIQDIMADVEKGRLEGFYSIHSHETKDFRTIALFPLVSIYFCVAKQSPQVRSDIDSAMDYFACHNMDFNWWLNNHYLKSAREKLTLDVQEINFVERNRGRKFRVGFPLLVNPVTVFDKKSRKASGFVTELFREIENMADIQFEFVGDGKADIYVDDHEVSEIGEDMIVLRDMFKLPTVRVSLPEDEISPEARNIWAVEAQRTDEINYLKENNHRVLICDSRLECYRAVAQGRAEATIDNFGSARLMIEEKREFRKLKDYRLDIHQIARCLSIAFPTDGTPELRRIFKKARSSISDTTTEKLFIDAVIASRRGRFTREDVTLYAVLTIIAILIFVVIILLVTGKRVRREKMDKLQFEAASKAKTEFLFNMSHDIRTPMNAIMGFTGIALKNLGDEPSVKNCIERTREAGGVLLSIINSILDMSRIEAGKAKLEEVEGDVSQSFANIEATLRSLACTRSISLSFKFGKITDRLVYLDQDRCVRIFLNLVSNAIKYTQEGGWVRVTCEQLDAPPVAHSAAAGAADDGRIAWYRYTFTDNGIGMSEEFQKHVFEQFSRERNTTMSGVQGTGLGLALCKSFVELMGGTISCHSQQGVGTTFVVDLPFKVREAAAADRAADDAELENKIEKANFEGCRVLIVEDNELNREVSEFFMKEHGFIVDCAEDGSVAVKMIREKGNDYYDCILMDIQMPIMNGYEATKVIRGAGCKRPIIAISANAFAEDKAESLKAGMDDHVAKPIRNKELLVALVKLNIQKT